MTAHGGSRAPSRLPTKSTWPGRGTKAVEPRLLSLRDPRLGLPPGDALADSRPPPGVLCLREGRGCLRAGGVQAMTKISQRPPRPLRLLTLTGDIARIGYHRLLANYHKR